MNNFELAKRNYDRKTWTKEQLQVLVNKNKLSAEDYKAITGEEYAGTFSNSGGAAPTSSEDTQIINTLLGVTE